MNIKLNSTEAKMNDIKIELEEGKEKIKQLKKALHIKDIELPKLKSASITYQKNINSLKNEIEQSYQKQFKYKFLKEQSTMLQYLCGLSIKQFQIILECVTPYIHLVSYPESEVNALSCRTTDKATELLSVPTICRHGLHQELMAYITDKFKSIMQRIFIGWVIFLATIFNEIDLKPASGFFLKRMPKSFIETGHGLTDLVVDATEFKFQSASNFELNSLMFFNYKNTHTGKALIGISPNGGGILFSEIYPGSISDSEITEKSNATLYVAEEHEIMSDRGFSIQDFCAKKVILLNRPKQKDSSQFS